MTPSSVERCHDTRSPTTHSLFLPREWQRMRSPSAVSTTTCRPWPETTRPGCSADKGDEGIGLRGADEIVARDAAGRVRREPHDAAIERDLQLRMVVFDVAHPGQRVDEGHRLEPVLEGEGLLDRLIGLAPAAGLRQVVADLRLAHRGGSLLALLLEKIGHGIGLGVRRGVSLARRSTAGGCE